MTNNPKRIVRRIRVLEYIGPEDWVIISSEGEARFIKGDVMLGVDKRIIEHLGEIKEVTQ
jgi:hypothetical protein